MLLKDQIAVVTGAGRGWGRAIAREFARQGARVVIVSRTRSEIDNTLQLLAEEGSSADAFSLDVSREEDWATLEGFVRQQYGRLDVLVNNAAVLRLSPFEGFSHQEIRRTLEINLYGAMAGCLTFLPLLRQRGGSIINVSSLAGVAPQINLTPYVASKYGLEGFSKTLALELRPDNIAVNTVTPGGMSASIHMKPTSMTESDFQALSPQEQAQFADPALYTPALVYLARQRADGVTGERIVAYELSRRIEKLGWDLRPEDLLVWEGIGKY